MKLLVGLGNPGVRYRSTPHNLGFEVLDRLARRWGGHFEEEPARKAEVLRVSWADERLILAKPTTFMNLSGQAVRELLRNQPMDLAELLIVSDEAQLEIGRLRLRAHGSDGGHNGLRSVIESLGSEEFPRLRIGVKPPEESIGDLRGYLLAKPPPEIRQRLERMAEAGAEAAACWVREGLEAAASRYNGLRVEGEIKRINGQGVGA